MVEGVILNKAGICLLAYADDKAILGNNLEIVKGNCTKSVTCSRQDWFQSRGKQNKNTYVIIGRRHREY